MNFAIRTTPHSTIGLTPFFAMHCREAVLPSQSFMKLEDQQCVLHESIQRRLDLFRRARTVVDEAYQERVEAIDRRNAALN